MLVAGKWDREEHNNILEARGVVAVLRHLSRSSPAWHKRVLIFTDSLVTLGCLGKGRSSARGLLRVCRQAAAIQLACRIRLYLRWVPSERNLADAPSRGGGVGVDADTATAHRFRGVPKKLLRILQRLPRVFAKRAKIHW